MTASINAVGGTAETFAVASAQTSLAQTHQVDLSQAKAAAKFAQLVQDKLYSKLSYEGVYANTDIVYDLQSNRVKESVILSKYDSTLRGYRYTLNTGGMIPVLDDKGNIAFYDAARENIVMTMPAPFLEDANGVHNYDIQVQLTGSGSTYTLTYILPQQWLADSARAYPVILDPIVSAGTGVNNIADQSVASNGSLNYTWSRVECGLDSTYGIERFFMAFTKLPELTSADVIVDATVSLYKPGASSSSFYVGVHSVASTWTSSTITWANMPSTGANAADSLTATSSGWYNWNVTSLAQNWYATGINTGMMFRASDAVENGTAHSLVQFCSSDNGSYSPTLTIEYRTVNNISVGDLIDIDISESGEKEYFSFTPATTGFYTLESSDCVGDPRVWLYNYNGELLENDDDSAGDYNFQLTYHLIAGWEYIIAAGAFSSSTTTYSLELYTTNASVKLSADSLILAGADRTVSNNIAFKSTCYTLMPVITREYLFYSQNASGDPRIYLYDSNYSLVTMDDNGAGRSNSRIVATLTAGQKYYLVAANWSSSTGAYTLTSLRSASISNGDYYAKNLYASLYLDIHGPEEQEYVHLWSFHTGYQAKWTFSQDSYGYYTIRSLYDDKYYMGISNTSLNTNNVKLFSGVSDYTKWKIYTNSSGTLLLEPKMAPGKVLCVPDANIDTELQLDYMGTNASEKSKWQIAYVSALLGQHVPSKTFSIQLVGDLANDSTWLPLITAAVNAWNNSDANTDISLTTESSPYTLQVGEFPIDEAAMERPSAASGTNVTAAYILINIDFMPNDDESRKGIIAHEIGHFLGLEDNPPVVDGNDSLMSYRRDREVIYIPQKFDAQNVKFIYD